MNDWRTAMRAGFAALLGAALVSGCGYQLRGSTLAVANLGSVYVDGPLEIRAALTNLLESGDTRVEAARDAAKTILTLTNETFSRRVLSVDPNTGNEREFELAYQVLFRVREATGKELIGNQTVTLLRDFVFDADAVIGKSREEGVLRTEMQRDAAEQIVRRIEAALGS